MRNFANIQISCTGWLAYAALTLFTALALALVWALCLPQAALAYVDPSVMTYTIQALAGVAVALSAVAGVAFRRVRRKIFQVFKVDENANKAVEGSIARIDPFAADADQQFADADDRAKDLYAQSLGNTDEKSLDRLGWAPRFAFALLMCVFAFFVILVAPAIEVIGGNSDSLVFSIDKVWWVSALLNGIAAVVCALLISRLKGRKYAKVLLFVFCLTFASYIQALFLNSGMMPADGGFIGWTDWYFVQKMIISGVIWAIIIVVPQLLSKERRYTWLKATSALAVAIVIMQGVGVGSVAVDASKVSVDEQVRPYVTQNELFTVSPKDNVIVFVLDTFDTFLLDEVVANDPHVLDNFTDFTQFRNSIGFMIPTKNSVPYLLTGEKPKEGESIWDYRGDRYNRGRFIPTVHDMDYSIGLYTDTSMLNFANPADLSVSRMTGNIHPVDNAPIDIIGTYISMNKCALYRQALWCAKPAFWYYTTEVNNSMVASADGSNADELYELDDAGILAQLKRQGLAATDDKHKGAFRFIHLFGPHFPYNLDENGNDIGVGFSDRTRQSAGSLKVVDEYIKKLKDLDLYDQSTIIVAADHGVWFLSEDPLERPSSPIMLVKPRMEKGGKGEALKESQMPISHEDMIPTIIDAMGGDATQFCSGQTVWQIDDPNRVRYYNALTNAGGEGQRMIEYRVEGGDCNDMSLWSKTGVEWKGAW